MPSRAVVWFRRDLRVAEVDRLDVTIENGKVTSYRARVNISFKYEGS